MRIPWLAPFRMMVIISAVACTPVTSPPPTPDAGAPDEEDVPDAGVAEFLPTLEAIEPSSGPAGTTFTIIGTGFEAGATVRFGAARSIDATVVTPTRIVGTVPVKEGLADQVPVIVGNPHVAEVALPGGFTYAARVPGTVQWCRLDTPAADRELWSDEPSTVSVSVYHPGETEAAGGSERVVAEVGRGVAGTLPSEWIWTAAPFLRQAGNDDVYATDQAGSPGRVQLGARVRLGAGPWMLCDRTGSDDGFSTSDVPVLTVKAVPLVASVEPASARVGELVTVFGEGFTQDVAVAFGELAAEVTQVATSGGSATVRVPDGAGEVVVRATVSRRSSSQDVRFTFEVDPARIVLATVAPQVVSAATPSTLLRLDGANFPEDAVVRIAGLSLVPDLRTSSRIEVALPAQPVGELVVRVEDATGARFAEFGGRLKVRARHTPVIDGAVGADWPATLRAATNTVESEWGSNALHRLFVAYDDTHLYLALEGSVEAGNAIVGGLGSSLLSVGLSDFSSLTDYSPGFDRLVSGTQSFATSVEGVMFQYAFGGYGDAPDVTNSPAGERGGVRGLANATCSGHCYTTHTFRRTASAQEFAIPWSASVGDDRFVARPDGGELRVFVRVASKQLDGTLYVSNQALPEDPSIGNGGPTETGRRAVTTVVRVPVD